MNATSAAATLRYRTLLQLLRTADALWTASHAFFARWAISPAQFNVINLLSGHSDGLSQTELGRLLITHRSNVTGLIDRLEKRGLVSRRNVVGDRRAYRIVLTTPGRRLLEQILPEFHELADAVWTGTSPRRARDLADGLAKIGRNAQTLTMRKEDT